jgi:hypothetical protein
LAFGLPEVVFQRASEWHPLGDIATLPRGLGSNKADRTYLAWVEVPMLQGDGARWEPLANGGEFSPWWRDDRGVADWRTPTGMTWVMTGAREPGWPYDQGPSPDYFRPGLSFPKQSASFNVAILPSSFLPTREGKAVIPKEENDGWWLLAYLNSGVVRAFVRDTCGLHKQSGAIARIPVPPFDNSEKERLAAIARSLVRLVLRSYRADETSRYFVRPECSEVPTASTTDWRSLIEELDSVVGAKFELQPADYEWCELPTAPTLFHPKGADIISWAVGVVFGRFSESVTELSDVLDPFAAVPATSSPAISGTSESRREVAVTDAGHPSDLFHLVSEAMTRRAHRVGENLMQWQESLQDLEQYIREIFFSEHLERYRLARRRAPIYWQLTTASSRYSVWLYIHAFSKDTLFRVQNDYVAPKLTHEERRLNLLASELRGNATAAQRKELAAQEAIVEELRAFLEEVKRVAPLWNPNLDDGVIINFAPLWRLVPQNKPWQKELKTTWEALCEGKYDWTYLAMNLWPERVVPKCVTERSFAIVHGLEDVFWVQGNGGKWIARKTPTRTVDELVRERNSPAVKSALKSLVEAPAATGNRGRGRGGRRRAVIAAEGGNA